MGILHKLTLDKRARADRVQRRPFFAVGFKSRGAVDVALAQNVHPCVVPRGVMQHDGVVVGLFVAFRGADFGRLAVFDQLVEIPDNRIGVEVAAVGELNAFAELDGQRQRIRIHGEGFRQPRLGVTGLRVAAAKGFHSRAEVEAVRGCTGQGGEHAVAFHSKHGQHAAVLGRRVFRQRRRQNGQEHQHGEEQCGELLEFHGVASFNVSFYFLCFSQIGTEIGYSCP